MFLSLIPVSSIGIFKLLLNIPQGCPVCTAHGSVCLIQLWWPDNSPPSEHTSAQAGMKSFQLVLQMFCSSKKKKLICTSQGVSNTHTLRFWHIPLRRSTRPRQIDTPFQMFSTLKKGQKITGAPWEPDQKHLIANFQKAWVIYRALGWVKSFLLVCLFFNRWNWIDISLEEWTANSCSTQA